VAAAPARMVESEILLELVLAMACCGVCMFDGWSEVKGSKGRVFKLLKESPVVIVGLMGGSGVVVVEAKALERENVR